MLRALLPLLLLPLLACQPPVEILVDDTGVTHVYAATDADAWYGAGYAVASDRLFQMEMLRRFAHGRLAEVLGEDGLERDQQARIFDLPRWGAADLEATREADPERAELISAWVAGINARIDELHAGEAPVPFGFRPDEYDFLPERWSEEDPYIVLKGAGFALDKTLEFEIAMSIVNRLYPEALESVRAFQPAHDAWGVPPEDQPDQVAHRMPPPATSPADDESPSVTALNDVMLRWARPQGSNNWGVDGRFTVDGRPMVAGDPHMGFDFFGAPYPLHVNSKDKRGTYDVAGFAFPGTPGIVLGHNDRVVWTCTSAFGDVMDVWRVDRVGEGVLVGDDVAAITTRIEAITVRGEGDAVGEGSTVVKTYEDVDGHGVVLPVEVLPVPVGDYLVDWTGFAGRPAHWFMELNRVQDLDEFEDAVGRMGEMNYSFVGADATGIAYRVGVDVPDRPDVTGDRAPWKAMPGGDAGSLWTGEILDDDRMPHGRAPDRGWIATANNDPFGFTADGRVDDDPWYYGAFFAPGYRAQRITSELTRLTERGDITLDDMQALQMDIHSTMADDVIPLLLAAREAADSDPALASYAADADIDALVALLESWDRQVSRDSTGAVAFHLFSRFLAEDTLSDDMTLAWDFAMRLKPLFMIKIAALALAGEYPDASGVLQEGRDAILLGSASRAAAWLKDRFGAVDTGFVWSDLKVTSLDHAYGFGIELYDVPTDGGEDTINVAQDITFGEEQWVTSYVSVERTVGRITDDGTPEAWVNFPLAGAADPESEGTAAALDDYVEGRYRRLLFSREAIDAAAVSRIEVEVVRP